MKNNFPLDVQTRFINQTTFQPFGKSQMLNTFEDNVKGSVVGRSYCTLKCQQSQWSSTDPVPKVNQNLMVKNQEWLRKRSQMVHCQANILLKLMASSDSYCHSLTAGHHMPGLLTIIHAWLRAHFNPAHKAVSGQLKITKGAYRPRWQLSPLQTPGSTCPAEQETLTLPAWLVYFL